MYPPSPPFARRSRGWRRHASVAHGIVDLAYERTHDNVSRTRTVKGRSRRHEGELGVDRAHRNPKKRAAEMAAVAAPIEQPVGEVSRVFEGEKGEELAGYL